jgi:hypothetical protein
MDAGPQGFQENVGSYMSPYMQNVVDVEKRGAIRDYQVGNTMQQAQATQAGAFGGGREAIQRAERERGLMGTLGGIQARGSQAAYDQAANQFRQGISQGMDVSKLQNTYGGQMQQQAQRPLDMAYQDFQNQQNYPYKQLGFMSDLVRGMPLGQKSTSSVYEAPGSTMGQLAGLGMGAYGLSRMMAEGGQVEDGEPVARYADGGVTSSQNVEGILEKLSDQQLQQAKQTALARRDVEQANMIDAEIAQRSSIRSGISAAITPDFADQMEEGMASGGIVAFADRGAVKEMPEKATSSIGDFLDTIGVSDAVNSLRESYYKSRETEKRREGAEDILPGITESMTPTERARRKAAGSELYSSEPKSVKKMTAQEIEAANAAITGSSKPAVASTSTSTSTSSAGAGRGSAESYAPLIGATASPKSAPAKRSETAVAGSKPSAAEVKSAVAQFAEQSGATKGEKDDYMTMALKLRDELGKQDQPILDKLNAAIEAQKPNEQAIKDRGIAQALTQFGFGLAEKASKPGARFLESASGAAPVLASVAEKTNALIDAKKENYAKMQMDQAKYEVALSQGKMQTAATLAGNINQAKQQDKVLDFNIAKAKDELALKEREFGLKERELANTRNYQNQMASRYETVGSLTRDIMQNEGLPYDKALEKAGRIMKPTGYAADVRAGTARNANLDKALEMIDAKFKLLPMLKPDNPKYAPMKAEYDALVRAAHVRYGEGGAQPSSAPTSLAQKGFKLLGTE